ncbi:PD-(D/E)XK nuclease family protein [Plantibacter sp. Leaf314]|uniref:PD-(D/E)XK nuclease family protein n=1 Tax=Plantibacter sp. Leaf314 TaxID=1736333 RepID=UPI0012FC14DF|nr:PD-(D/E)XK nuclease family protein [Plantibacter sp. Leaf314]
MHAPDPIPVIAEPIVIFVINRGWSPDADSQATYDATRKYWRVGSDTRERARYALGVAGGIVRGAFRIQSWHPGEEEGRWGFEGVPAPELGVVGTSVERLAPPRGAANPVRRYLGGIPPTEERPVESLAHELNIEPLARIMYGQRELFHSNLLAWFFDTLPEIADSVFRDLTVDDPSGIASIRSVERERQSLDLVLRWPAAAPLVIENKVFSLPEREQLDDYRNKTAKWKGAPAQHVLLSMSPPREPVDGWTYLSYQELSERIDLALAECDEVSYEVETVRRYSRTVRLLSALLNTTAVHSTKESVWLDGNQLAAIDLRQTRTALQKLRARRVQVVLEEMGVHRGWVDAGHTRGGPLVWWVRGVRIGGTYLEAGWQYQSGQFRRCVVLPHLIGRSDGDRNARAEFAAAHPQLFDFAPLDDVLGHPDLLPMPLDGFGHFAPDFVHRYVKAPDLSIEQLVGATQAIDAQLEALGE